MSGKGISDAVRDSIRDWITPEITAKIKEVIPNYLNTVNVLQSQLKNESSWTRTARRKYPSGGFERDYDCSAVRPKGMVGLQVRTNADDTRIKYVTFRINGKFIGGGLVDVPSVLVNQRGRQRTIKDLTFTDEVTKYRQFTEDEIKELNKKIEFGDEYAIDNMFNSEGD